MAISENRRNIVPWLIIGILVVAASVAVALLFDLSRSKQTAGPADKPLGVVWEKTFGGAKADVAYSIVALPDGGFAVAGVTKSKGAGNKDAWVLRLDGKGRILWEKAFGGAKADLAYSIIALPDGGFAVAGETKSKGADKWDAWVLRLDGTGRMLWEKNFG